MTATWRGEERRIRWGFEGRRGCHGKLVVVMDRNEKERKTELGLGKEVGERVVKINVCLRLEFDFSSEIR